MTFTFKQCCLNAHPLLLYSLNLITSHRTWGFTEKSSSIPFGVCFMSWIPQAFSMITNKLSVCNVYSMPYENGPIQSDKRSNSKLRLVLEYNSYNHASRILDKSSRTNLGHQSNLNIIVFSSLLYWRNPAYFLTAEATS